MKCDGDNSIKSLKNSNFDSFFSFLTRWTFHRGLESTHGALRPFTPQVIPESSIRLPQHSLAPIIWPSLSVSLPQSP